MYDEETEELSDDVVAATGKVADLTKVSSNGFAGVSLWADAAQTQYRSLKDYLGDIAKIWDEIDAKSQTKLLESLFGKRGASVGSAIIKNFDQVEHAIEEMENAAGAADAEMSIIKESVDYKLNELKETWVGIWQDLLDRGDINTVIDLLTKLSEAIGFVTEKLGLLGTASFGLAGFLQAKDLGLLSYDKASGQIEGLRRFRVAQKELNEDTQDFIDIIKQYGNVLTSDQIDKAAAGYDTLDASVVQLARDSVGAGFEVDKFSAAVEKSTKSSAGLTAGLKTLGKQALVTIANFAAMAAINFVIQGVVYVIDQAITTTEEQSQKVAKLTENYESLKKEYEELAKKAAPTAAEQARLEYLESRLALDKEILDLEKRQEAIYKTGASEDWLHNFSEMMDSDSIVTTLKEAQDAVAGIYNQLGSGYTAPIVDYEDQLNKLNEYVEQVDAKVQKQADQERVLVENEELYRKMYEAQWGPHTDEGFEDYKQGIIDRAKEEYDYTKELEKESEQIQKVQDSYQNALSERNKFLLAKEQIESYLPYLTGADAQRAQDNLQILNDAIDRYDAYIDRAEEALGIFHTDTKEEVAEIIAETSKALSFGQVLELNPKVEISDDIQKELDYLTKEYQAELTEASAKNIDLNKTVFGHIDTNNRQILRWTDETLNQYKDALMSWANDGSTWEDIRSELIGGFSTVMGASDEYDGVEIAFSPILQTTDGAKLLSKETVDKYINQLIDNAGEGWTDKKLLELDVVGLEIDGLHIRNILADIGDTAIQTGEAMHFVGVDGSLQTLERDIDHLNTIIAQSATDWPKVRQELVGMAQAGKLDTASLRAYKYFDDILKAIGKDADITDEELEGMISTINSMAIDNAVDDLHSYGEQLSKLESAYISFKKGERITAEQLSDLQDAFGDTEAYQKFQKEVLSGNTDLQESFNALATELATNVLNNLTEDEKEYYIAELRSIGVVNAREAAEKQLKKTEQIQLNQKKALQEANQVVQDSNANLIISTENLESASYSELTALMQEAEQSGFTSEALALLALKKAASADIDLTNTDDLDYLLRLADMAGISTNALTKLAFIKAQIANKQADLDAINIGATSNYAEYMAALGKRKELTGEITDLEQQAAGYQEQLQKELDESTKKRYTIDFGLDYDGGDKVKDELDKTSSSAENSFDELFDFFERRIEVLTQSIELLGKEIDNVLGSGAKNQLLDAQRSIYQEEVRNYEDAAAMYQEMANAYYEQIPDDFKEKIRDGAVAIDEFMGEADEATLETIKSYQEWANKVDDCNQTLAELKKKLRELELQKFNNIVDDFTKQFDIRGNAKDLIDKQIALFEEAGELVGEAFYREQISQTNAQLDILNREKDALVEAMNSAIQNGVDASSDEWHEMVSTLSSLEGQILETETAVESLDNAILALNDATFERIQTRFGDLRDELSDLIDLFKDEDVALKDNTWTEAGTTQLGLYAQQYEIAMHNVGLYSEAIEELNQQYADGKYSATEYAEKLQELYSAQRGEISNAEAAREAIMELNRARVEIVVAGINEEIEAFNELTNAAIDALNSEKDLHDYEKSIAESTKSIVDLEQQLAALRWDTSTAANAKRKKLQAQLAKAREELEEKEYDHSISEQQRMLQEQAENYQKEREEEIERLEESLKDEEKIISDSMDHVQDNADVVLRNIENIAQQYGIQISEQIKKPWEQGSNAISDYQTSVENMSSATIDQLRDVEAAERNLQLQADATAEGLANMFGQRADTLLSEMDAAQNSASNLQNTINALNNSFVNALERGYDISNVLANLQAIQSAANAAADSVSRVGGGGGGGYTPPSTEEEPDEGYLDTSQASISDNINDKAYYYWDDAGNIKGSTLDQKLAKDTAEKLRLHWGTGAFYRLWLNEHPNGVSSSASGGRRGSAITTTENMKMAGKPVKVLSDGSYLVPLQESAQILPNNLVNGITDSFVAPVREVTQELHKAMDVVVSKSTEPNFTVTYDSLVTVNGNVNDSQQMLTIAAQQAEQKITKTFKDMSAHIYK